MNGIRAKAKQMPAWLRALTCAMLLCLVATLVGVGLAENVEYSNDLGTLCNGSIRIKTTVDLENAEWEITKDNDVKGYVMSSLGATDTTYTPNTSSAKITNISGKALKLSFEWSANSLDYLGRQTPAGTVSVKKETTSYSTNITGKFNEVIAAGESVIVSITSATADRLQNYPIENITLSDFAIDEAANNFVYLGASYDGGYTVQTGDGETVTVSAANAEDGSFTVQKGSETAQKYNINDNTNLPQFTFTTTDGLTVSANANTGKSFYLWQELKDGKNVVLSEKDGKIYPDNETTITPVFIDNGQLQNDCFKVDNKLYYYWDDAMQAAAKDNSKVVTLTKDYTLPDNVANAGRYGTYAVADENGNMTYNIPTGVTVVVPFDADDAAKLYRTDYFTAEKALNASPTAPTSPYVTLEVPQNVTLNIPQYATFLVNAKIASYETYNQSCVVGTYGKVTLGGTINVSGTLYANGYIADKNHKEGVKTGKINALAGSTVWQIMQVKDFRGGRVTSAVSEETMAINMYYFQNIMANITYEYGSELKANIAIYSSAYKLLAPCSVSVISNGKGTGSMFSLTEGSITTEYDYNSDRLAVSVNGKVEMNYLSIDNQYLPIDTKQYQLAISDNMPITVKDRAALTIKYGLKFLPGAKVTVEENANLNIAESAKIFLYSKETYQPQWANNSWRTTLFSDLVKAAEGKTAYTEAKIDTGSFDDAQIVLNGTLNIADKAQVFQSSDHKTGIEAGANAVVNVGGTLSASGVTCGETYMTAGNVKEATDDDIANATEDSNGRWTAKKVQTEQGGNFGLLVTVKNWEPVNGRMADGDKAAAEYQPFAEPGSYRVTDINGNLAWYKHAVTYQNAGATGAGEVRYYATDNITYAMPAGKVATDVQFSDAKIALDSSANINSNINSNIADGWETISMTALTAVGDFTATLTTKDYAHRVIWYENFGTTSAKQWADYITGDQSTYSFTTNDVNFASNPVITDDEDNLVTELPGKWTEAGSKKSYTLSGINKNITVKMWTVSDKYVVTFKVTDPNGQAIPANPVLLEKKTDQSCTYTVPQPTDEKNNQTAWYIVNTVTANGGAKVTDNKESVTVSKINGNVEVEIQLAKYDTKVSFTVNKDPNKTIAPQYANKGSTVTVSGNGAPGKMAFESASLSGGTAQVNKLDNTLTVSLSDTVGLDTPVDVTMTGYTYVVRTLVDGDTVDAKYLDENASYEYTLTTPRTYITNQPVGVTVTNPATSADGDFAKISVENVTQDMDIVVTTAKFAHVVTWDVTYNSDTDDFTDMDDFNRDICKSYVTTGSTSAYNIRSKDAYGDQINYLITTFSISGSANANIYGHKASRDSAEYLAGKSLSPANPEITLSGIDADVTVTAEAHDYSRVITWKAISPEEQAIPAASYQQYISSAPEGTPNWNTDGSTTEASYNCIKYSIPTGQKYFISKIKGPWDIAIDASKKCSEEHSGGFAATFTVTLMPYEHEVKINGTFAGEDMSTSFYTDAQGYNAETSQSIVYRPTEMGKWEMEWGDFPAKYYFVYGQITSVTADKEGVVFEQAEDSQNTLAEGWKSLKITNVTEDTTITVSGETYHGIVNYSVNGEKKIAFVTVEDFFGRGDMPTGKPGKWQWTAPEGQMIKDAITANGSNLSFTKTMVKVNLNCTINYNDDPYNEDDYTETYTYPEITVSITTDTPEFYALLGDMSYELHKNSATYKWDKYANNGNGAFRFSPNETYCWRHRTGSVGHDVRFHNGDMHSYNVANGTVLLVNNSPVSVAYTAQLAKAKGTYDASWAKMEFSLANDTRGGEATIATDENGVATITVPANSTVTLVTNMVGQPILSDGKVDLGLNNVEIGSFEITGKALLN